MELGAYSISLAVREIRAFGGDAARSRLLFESGSPARLVAIDPDGNPIRCEPRL